MLERRHDLERGTTAEIAEAADERLSADGLNTSGLPEHRAADLYDKGKLNDDEILTAIGRGDRQFLSEALALKTGFSPETVEQVFASQSPRIRVALCWKAGLSMRTAFQAQLKIAHIPSGELINAKDACITPSVAPKCVKSCDSFQTEPDRNIRRFGAEWLVCPQDVVI